ncbi:hypothetical protein OH492_17550 [Vibrio chagasii]|nr:hypothetical protein [Vibrio chagasii]
MVQENVMDNARALHYFLKSLTLVRLEEKARSKEIEVAAKLAKDNSLLLVSQRCVARRFRYWRKPEII